MTSKVHQEEILLLIFLKFLQVMLFVVVHRKVNQVSFLLNQIFQHVAMLLLIHSKLRLNDFLAPKKLILSQ